MKILILTTFILFGMSKITYSQNFMTFYTPGYQVSGFKATNVDLDYVYGSSVGDVKGSVNNLLCKGDGIIGGWIYGMDVSQILLMLVSGFTTDKRSLYADAFSVRLGGAGNVAENTKFGAAVDIGARSFQYVKDGYNINGSHYRFVYLGITFQGLHAIDEKIYIMPKLSLNPMFGAGITDKVTRGMSTKFEVSLGYRLGGNFGLSITPGFERMKFLSEGESPSGEYEIFESFVKTKFLQFGVSFMFD